jgi:hypothetical protein
LKLLRRLMDLLGVELAHLATLDHFRCVPERRRPVEAAATTPSRRESRLRHDAHTRRRGCP